MFTYFKWTKTYTDLLTKQNPPWLILYLGVKSFGQPYSSVISEKHIFKQRIQQNQLQINLPTNWHKTAKEVISQIFQSNSKIKTVWFFSFFLFFFFFFENNFRVVYISILKTKTLISDKNLVGQNIFKETVY